MKSLRVSRGLSTKEMADLLHISVKTYKRKEESPDKILVGELKVIVKDLNVNPLELTRMYDPFYDPL